MYVIDESARELIILKTLSDMESADKTEKGKKRNE